MLAYLMMASVFSLNTFAGETNFTVDTPRGAKIHVILSLPETLAPDQKVPAVVAAPGRGYHMGLPLYQELRSQGARAGLAVVTFDWNFFRQGIEPSPDKSLEQEDMQAVLNFVKSDPRLDANRILLSGKSFGSVVAHKVFAANPAVIGLHLLTPLCQTEEMFHSYYPGFAATQKPALFLYGTSDEACSTPVVKKVLSGAGANLAIAMVPGGHGFELGEGENFEALNRANMVSIVSLITAWAKAQLAL